MTETRKAIIELIEPYMDKTFYTWLIYIDYHWDYWIVWETWEKDWELVTQHWLWVKSISDMKKWNYKILWHYDITAVLKYINSEYYNYWNSASYLENDIKISCIRNNIIEYIPNKPLYLYSEQEEKDLLNLLTTLKTNE